ncbi:MAG TPA: CHASE4 domain-containing protein [Stenomitos sp.]
MTLRQKTVLIIGVTLLCLLVTLYLSLSTIWLNRVAKIEFQQTRQNVERVTEALANNLQELNSTAKDWAGWDDTYAFVADVNERYIQENLAEASLANLRLNFMLFLNTRGQIKYGKGLDLQQKVTLSVPASLKQYLTTRPRFFLHNTLNSNHTGIVLIPEGFLLVASHPILKSDRTGPIRGSLILGRFLNKSELIRLSQLTRLPITIYPFHQAQLPKDFKGIKDEFTQQLSHAKTLAQSSILVHPLSSERIAGYTLLRDIEGQPRLLLRVDTSREIYQQGKQGLHYLALALLVVGLAFGCVTLLLLEKWVLSPLSHFSATVRKIRTKGDLKERLLTEGRDELSRLGTEINQMLAGLQESQLQLSQSEEGYRSVVNNVQEVIFQTDSASRWIFLNPAWTEITGFSVEESLGKLCWTFIHPEDQPYHNEHFRQLIQGKIQDTRYELRFQTHDNGCYRILEVHSHLIVGRYREIAGIAGTLNDITERKLAEAREHEKAQELERTLLELTQTQSQLIQSEKMSSLGQLVAGVAHEINNPISFVYGNIVHAEGYIKDLIDLLNCYRQEYPNPSDEIIAKMQEIDFDFVVDDLPKLLASMKIGAERIRDIVQSLRNFSRLSESERKKVDIHEGIESTLLILKHKIRAKDEYSEIELIKEYGDLPWVECYPGHLNQVLMNLIANAIDALEERRLYKFRDSSQSSPFIRICTEVKEDPSSQSDDSDVFHILIHIADNGTGMTEEVRRRLFDPFFTTKPIGKGTGLGLSISYKIIVEKHKGQVLVKSELGQGSEFIIELPIRQIHV